MTVGRKGPRTQLIVLIVKLCLLLVFLARLEMKTIGTDVACGLVPRCR